MKKQIYLDNHATTMIDPRVLEAMMPYLKEEYGNSSSRTHSYGWAAEEAVDNAREQLANLINAESNQIIFTSGATESNNMALFNRDGHMGDFLLSAIEHSSIKNTVKKLRGFSEIKVNSNGIVSLDYLEKLIEENDENISDVYVMMVNNEIGTIQPIKEIKEIIPYYTCLHSDMAQALGKIKIDVQELDVDSASFSAHKIYGPKGVGALYVKDPEGWEPLIAGGNQEFGLRAGTLNIPGIVGFGKACEILYKEKDDLTKMNVLFKEALRFFVPRVKMHEFPNMVPNTVHFAVPCIDMDMFMSELEPNVAISFGSACMSLHDASSYVLEAISIPKEEILRSIRVGIGRFNTKEEIELAAKFIGEAVRITNLEE